MSIKFESVQLESSLKGETNDCAVKALSLSSGIEYKTAHSLLAICGRKHGKGTKINQIERAIKLTGREVELIRLGKAITVANITNHFPTGSWIAVTRSHALAVVDGKVEDWTEGRKHRIVRLYKMG